MIKQAEKKLRRWELALLLGVAVAALLGVWLDGQQAALADRVVRLHVVANSDSAEDQALKLEVRDRVLREAEVLLDGRTTPDEAAAILADHLDELAGAGAQAVADAGYAYPVTASLEDSVWFPTKAYQDFSLPAGRYRALRVVVGEGSGQNWWCVVFPPLCLGSVTETTAETAAGVGFDPEQMALITGESEGYVVKFKALELLESLKEWAEHP